jgi:hypothetical protein
VLVKTTSRTIQATVGHHHFAKPEALYNLPDIVLRALSAAILRIPILQLGLLELALSFFTDFTFEVRVRGKGRCHVNKWLTRIGGLFAGPLPLALRLLSLVVNGKRRRTLRKAAAISASQALS